MQELAVEKHNRVYKMREDEDVDFTYIFDAYYKRLYNFNYYRTHNQAVAEDLTSQTFEKAMRGIQSFNEEKAPFEVWFFTIARNVVNDYFRKQKKYPWESLEKVFEMVSNEKSPECRAIEREEKNKLLAAVRRLNDKERTMVAYKYGAGLKNKEIAALMDMKEKTVGTALCRTLKKLRADLQEDKCYE